MWPQHQAMNGFMNESMCSMRIYVCVCVCVCVCTVYCALLIVRHQKWFIYWSEPGLWWDKEINFDRAHISGKKTMFRLLCMLSFYGDWLIDYIRKTQDHKERRITSAVSWVFALTCFMALRLRMTDKTTTFGCGLIRYMNFHWELINSSKIYKTFKIHCIRGLCVSAFSSNHVLMFLLFYAVGLELCASNVQFTPLAQWSWGWMQTKTNLPYHVSLFVLFIGT